MEDLEKKLLAGRNENKTKVCMCLLFQNLCLLSQANGWTEGAKACQLAASLRGEAAEVLQTHPDTERLHLNSLYNILDLRFGQNYSKDCARLQMKTRLQKNEGSLQEYASKVERLANLAFSDQPATVREVISLQYFVDCLKEGDGEIEIENANHKGWNFEPRETQLQVLGMRWNGTPEKKLSSSKERREHCLFFQTGKLICGHLVGRKLPDNEKPHHKILQIAAVNGGDKELYVIRQTNNISCRMVVDTEANVSIIRNDLAQNSKLSVIWTPPFLCFHANSDG
ncbi:uncharacterized protein TNCV_2599181 [Trichonephila clavipes]|nr:uncharacterized protein TNCV_2599181 [Trichonephila clavipes]